MRAEDTIQKLELKKGDTLVVTTQHPVSADQAKLIKARLVEFLPVDVKIMIIDKTMQLKVLTRGNDEVQA